MKATKDAFVKKNKGIRQNNDMSIMPLHFLKYSFLKIYLGYLMFSIVQITKTQVKFYELPVVVTKKMLREVKMIIRRAADIEVQELQSNDDPTSIIN